MTETPIHDGLLELSRNSHKAGWVEGRDSMKRDVLRLLRSIPKPSKSTLDAIDRIERTLLNYEAGA